MSAVCVQSSGSHPICANSTSKTSNINIIRSNCNNSNNINSYRNYGNEIAITTLPALQTLSTLNCSDIGIDVNNYGNNCLNQSIQTIKANAMSQMLSSSCVPSVEPNPPFIQIPFGWKRELIDGRIVYLSPTNVCLQSMEQLSKYLESDGTCKCGLECPLYISKTFSFDASIPSKAYDIEVAKNNNQNKLCNHKRKIIALAEYRVIEHSLQTKHLIAHQHQQQHRSSSRPNLPDDHHLDSDKQSYGLDYSPKTVVESKRGQRQDFQSSGNPCAQTNDCFTLSNESNPQNVGKYSNDSIIDAVSVIHSNQNYSKLGQTLGVTETVMSRLSPNCSYLMSQNVNRFVDDSSERQTHLPQQPQYLHQTSNCDNRCQYSVPMRAEHIPQAANSFCVYDQSGNSSVYSFSTCDSTHISLQPNDNKTSIYLTPQNTTNFGQMISYDNPNVNLIQPTHTQAYNHAFHHSDNVCNSNISTIPSYIPLHSPNSNSGTISFNASPLSTASISLNPTYQDRSRCHSQNSISILPHNPHNPPMPRLSVPNVTTVTTSVNDVIPAVGVAPQIINTTNTSGAPQVLQFINSVPLTQITANTVTVLQQSAAQEVPVPATTLIIPQLMSQHEHPMVINHGMAAQTAMFPHIATATGLTTLPNAFQSAISIANAMSLPQRSCIPEPGKQLSRTRKRKEYNRTNRSHPPTVASILKQAADNEKKKKELELSEKHRLQQQDNELEVICETNESNCQTICRTDESDSFVESGKESISVAVQSELPVDLENMTSIDCNRSQDMESSDDCNDSITGEDSIPVVHRIQVHNNSDSSSEQSSPSSECGIGAGSDSGVESEPIATQLSDNCEVSDTRQDIGSDDECPQSPPKTTFNAGDLVWGQMRDVRYWPGKIVTDQELTGLSIDRQDGKLIVKWFGDHTLTQVDPQNLKTLSEGLEEHHCARKRHRSGKRLNTSLDQAIQEAMEELDRQTDDMALGGSSAVLDRRCVVSTQTNDTMDEL